MSQQQSQLSAYDEGVATYECPYCEFEDDHEWMVRVHIHRSEAKPHHHRDGFMPEDELNAIDPTGDVIETIPGNPTRRFEVLQNLEPEDMPDALSYPEQVIVLTAIQNLTDNYSTVQEEANQRLLDEGFEAVDYNKAYRTAIETLGVARKSKNMSQQQSQKSYEDLTDKQRAVINEYIRNPDPDKMTDLARNAGVDPSYPQTVIDKYGHIAEGMTNVDVIPVEQEEDVGSEQTDQPTPSSRNDPTPTIQKEYNDLTDLQREVLDELVEHPEKSHKEISESVGCDGTYPVKVEDKFSHIIQSRRSSRRDSNGRVKISLDDTEYLVGEALANEFNDLTKKQQAVIGMLLDEDDPTEPEQSRDEIGQKAGVHGTYVEEVRKKYGDLATRLKQDALPADSVSEDLTEVEEELVQEPAETPAEPDTEEEVPFLERFKTAVESESVTDITVREILDNIDDIENVELIRRANVADSRKTTTSAYEERIDGLVEDTESESEVIEDDSTQADEENLTFTEEFAQAVESESVTDITVREILDNIDDIENVELIRQANDLDTRKTATTAYEERLDEVGEPMEDEDDVEPSMEEVESESPESAESIDTETETAETSDIQETSGVPPEKLQNMRDRTEMLIRTAESELENSDQKAPAARAKSVAEEFQRMLDDAMSQN